MLYFSTSPWQWFDASQAESREASSVSGALLGGSEWRLWFQWLRWELLPSTHLNQGEHISEHTRSQSCTKYPSWTCLGAVTCLVTDLSYCIEHSSCFHLSWLPVPCVLLGGLECVMCLSLFPPVLGLVLFNYAVTQTGNHNYKEGSLWRWLHSCSLLCCLQGLC